MILCRYICLFIILLIGPRYLCAQGGAVVGPGEMAMRGVGFSWRHIGLDGSLQVVEHAGVLGVADFKPFPVTVRHVFDYDIVLDEARSAFKVPLLLSKLVPGASGLYLWTMPSGKEVELSTTANVQSGEYWLRFDSANRCSVASMDGWEFEYLSGRLVGVSLPNGSSWSVTSCDHGVFEIRQKAIRGQFDVLLLKAHYDAVGRLARVWTEGMISVFRWDGERLREVRSRRGEEEKIGRFDYEGDLLSRVETRSIGDLDVRWDKVKLEDRSVVESTFFSPVRVLSVNGDILSLTYSRNGLEYRFKDVDGESEFCVYNPFLATIYVVNRSGERAFIQEHERH